MIPIIHTSSWQTFSCREPDRKHFRPMVNESGWVPIKFYLQKPGTGQGLPAPGICVQRLVSCTELIDAPNLDSSAEHTLFRKWGFTGGHRTGLRVLVSFESCFIVLLKNSDKQLAMFTSPCPAVQGAGPGYQIWTMLKRSLFSNLGGKWKWKGLRSEWQSGISIVFNALLLFQVAFHSPDSFF